MDATLNLFERALALGRRYHELGQLGEAARILNRLARCRDLPAPTAEETQARLGEVALKRRRYGRARRHLTAALALRPDSARYHRLLAAALYADERTDADRAADHYRRALELDPADVACRSEFGLFLVRAGDTDEGLAHLRQAAAQAPDDVTAAARLVKGYRLAGRYDDAVAAARAALFRNPGSPRFVQLWQDVRFRQARRAQLAARRQHRAAATVSAAEPAVLPFVRRDRPAPLPAPHFPRAARRWVQ